MLKKLLFLSLIFLSHCKSVRVTDKSYTSNKIIIQKVSDHVYRHTSYLQTQSFGRVSCNGMVVFDSDEAIVYDTPADDSTSSELIKWISDSLNCKVKAIIPTHFHEDCLGGLAEFHRQGIPSYASNKTIASARQRNYQIPQNGFDDLLELQTGDRKVITAFFGEGHTRDNVIGYFPSEKVLFGGCLIKEIDAAKGNLEDANVQAWPETVTKIKAKYPDIKVVIPGHGKSGDTALLDYTIRLFQKN